MSSTVIRSKEEVSNELVYYNCDIINTGVFDLGTNSDPVCKFEESRSTPLIKDASKFNFSIVRCTLDGPNKNLPLFIPTAQKVQYFQQYDNNTGTSFRGQWSAVANYLVGEIVGLNPGPPNIGGVVATGPFYKARVANTNSNPLVSIQDWDVYYPPLLTIYSITIAGSITTGGVTTQITPIQRYVRWDAEKTDEIPPRINPDGTIVQSIGDPYWWGTTYSHWVDCVNATLSDIWDAIKGISPGLITQAPIFVYSSASGLFSISYDSNGFGDNSDASLIALTGNPNLVSPYNVDNRINWSAAAPTDRNERLYLFFNSNMNGLFSNFNSLYVGDDFPQATDYGRDYLLIVNGEQTATYDPLVVSTTLNPGLPTSVVPYSLAGYPDSEYYPRTLFVMIQDYQSTSSLWSPISAIVFTTTLLPTLPENTGQPFQLATGDNIGINPTTNAFQPIITDIAIPVGNAADYRQFINYTPSAEYRLTSLGTSPIDIRNIDVQIFWKSRLTNELFPLRMYNQSSVHLKILFRKKNGGM